MYYHIDEALQIITNSKRNRIERVGPFLLVTISPGWTKIDTNKMWVENYLYAPFEGNKGLLIFYSVGYFDDRERFSEYLNLWSRVSLQEQLFLNVPSGARYSYRIYPNHIAHLILHGTLKNYDRR